MAEFSEVSREYIRMCESFFETCEGCPINTCSGNVCRDRVLKNPEKYEDTIMKWAAEHPVYPTWEEWLIKSGILLRGNRGTWQSLTTKATDPIPADIALKLGLQPKDG